MSARPAFEQSTAHPPQPAGEVVTQQAGDPGQGQELTISKLENAITSMEEQGLQNDHRHAKALLLKQKLQASMPEGQQEAPGGSQQITPAQLAQLKAQVSAYKLLARNEPVPEALVTEAVMLRPKVTTLLPEPYEYPGESESGEKLPYDLMKIFSLHQIRCNRPTTIAPPTGIDPAGMLKQRENAIQNRIGLRMKLLCNLPTDIPEHMKLKAEIELRAYRLADLQKKVRREVMACMRNNETLETALNPFAYRRVKHHLWRDAKTENIPPVNITLTRKKPVPEKLIEEDVHFPPNSPITFTEYSLESLSLENDLSAPKKAAFFLFLKRFEENQIHKNFPLLIDENKSPINILAEPGKNVKNADHVDTYNWNLRRKCNYHNIYIGVRNQRLIASRKKDPFFTNLLKMYSVKCGDRLTKKVSWLESLSDRMRKSPILIQYSISDVSDTPVFPEQVDNIVAVPNFVATDYQKEKTHSDIRITLNSSRQESTSAEEYFHLMEEGFECLSGEASDESMETESNQEKGAFYDDDPFLNNYFE